jgi:hypothetical protein
MLMLLFSHNCQSHNAAHNLQKGSKTHNHKDPINQLLRDKRPSLRSANYVANQRNIQTPSKTLSWCSQRLNTWAKKHNFSKSIHNIPTPPEGAVLNFYTRPSHKHWIPTFPAFRKPSISPGGFRPRARARSHRANLVIPRHGPYAMFMSNSRNTSSFSS